MQNHLSFYQTTTHVVGSQKSPLNEVTFLKEQSIQGQVLFQYLIYL